MAFILLGASPAACPDAPPNALQNTGVGKQGCVVEIFEEVELIGKIEPMSTHLQLAYSAH